MTAFDPTGLTTTDLDRTRWVTAHAATQCREQGHEGAARIFDSLRALLVAEGAFRATGIGRPRFRVDTLRDLAPDLAAAERDRACFLASGLRDANALDAARRT